MFSKKVICLFLFFIFIHAINVYSNTGYYAKIVFIKSENGSTPVLKHEEEDINIKTGDIINENETIITFDKETVELILYQNDYPIGIFLLLGNSDLSFNVFDDTININLNYGGVRAVSQKNKKIVITSKTVKAISNNGDFCFISTSGDNSERRGYTTVFDGTVELASLEDPSNSENIKQLQKSDFISDKVYPPVDLAVNDLKEWIDRMLFKSKDIAKNLSYALETYSVGQKEEEKNLAEEEKNEEIKNDIIKNKESKSFIAGYLLKFELGVIFYDTNIANVAPKFVYKPGGVFKDKYEIGFYFPVNLVISKVMTDDRFLKVNGTNNEWSFGIDHLDNIGEMIFDIFDDLHLKHRIFKYNNPEDDVYIKVGDEFDVSDYLQFSLVDFNSYAFYPVIRKVSLVNNYKFDWFEAFIYAEDIMPKGLYGADVSFMTPYKSFRFRFRTSAFIDCYDLVKFDNKESFFPAQFNTTIDYDAFNVKSLGFSIFMSYGMYLPFSYNQNNYVSTYYECANKNPQAIASNMAFNTGFLLRIYTFNIGLEYIIDSGLNKVGMFDPLYIAKRDNRSDYMSDYLNEMLDRPVNIYDYNFGFRIKLSYNYLNNFFIESHYQLTFPEYYDKFYFKVGYDSKEKFKVNFNIYFMFEAEKLVTTFTDLKNLQLNALAYLGGGFTPYSGIDINFRGGVYPDFINYNSPLYSKFMFDCYVSFDAEKIFKKINSDKIKNANKK